MIIIFNEINCRLLTDFEESAHCTANNPGTYSSVCIELEIESLAVNTLLQYHHIHDVDGTSNFVAFHNQQLTTVQVSNLFWIDSFKKKVYKSYFHRIWQQVIR